jgi:hypothetical protein
MPRFMHRILQKLSLDVHTVDGSLVKTKCAGQDGLTGRAPFHDPCERSNVIDLDGPTNIACDDQLAVVVKPKGVDDFFRAFVQEYKMLGKPNGIDV